MVGKIQVSFLVSRGSEINFEFIAIVKCVVDGDFNFPRVALFAVGTDELQPYSDRITGHEFFC